MARPLEYKRRVRLPDFEAPPMPRRRRTPVVAVGLAAWAASVAFAWGVRAGTIPVGSWLTPSPDSASYPSRPARPRAPLPLPPPPAPVTLPPLEPVPAIDPEPEPAPAVATASAPEPSVRVALADEPAIPQRAAVEPWVPTPAPTFDAPARRTTIDSVAPLPNLEPTPTRDPTPSSTRADVPAPPGGTSVGKSCEAAAAEYRDEIVVGKDRGPADLTAADYAAVLNRGSWFAHCGLPDRATLDVCVAVQNGRARGVTVRTSPRDGAVERCIARAAAGLSFPSHPRLDVARSRF